MVEFLAGFTAVLTWTALVVAFFVRRERRLRDKHAEELDECFRHGWDTGAKNAVIVAALEAEQVFARKGSQFRVQMRKWCAVNGLNVDLEQAITGGHQLDRIARNKGET